MRFDANDFRASLARVCTTHLLEVQCPFDTVATASVNPLTFSAPTDTTQAHYTRAHPLMHAHARLLALHARTTG